MYCPPIGPILTSAGLFVGWISLYKRKKSGARVLILTESRQGAVLTAARPLPRERQENAYV